jgi:hypothetical protein
MPTTVQQNYHHVLIILQHHKMPLSPPRSCVEQTITAIIHGRNGHLTIAGS